MQDKIQIVIVDDHPIVRRGLRQILDAEPDLTVMAEASDGEAGLALIEALLPTLAVVDLDMPKLDGFEVAREVHTRGVPVGLVFLTIHGGVDLLHKAIDLGVQGYVLKEGALVEIVNCVRSVAAGQPFVSPSMVPDLLKWRMGAQAMEQARPAMASLTPSERRILRMVAEGKSSKEIAAELHIHFRTVETHRANICHKLNLSGPNNLLRFALEHRSELSL